LLLFCLISLPTLAQQPRPGGVQPRERVITILNRASQPISALLVSGFEEDDWGLNRLGVPALAPGRSFRVRLGRVRDCAYDLQVTYDDGRVEEKRGQDACRGRRIVFDGAHAALLADRTERQMLLLNRARRTVRQVFFSPKEATSWGDDLLAPGRLESGADARLTYRGECVVDLRVVFDNNSAEERREVDLCGHPTVMIAPGWTTRDDMQVSEAVLSQIRPVFVPVGAGADFCAAPALAPP
jgi:hypothetical protein